MTPKPPVLAGLAIALIAALAMAQSNSTVRYGIDAGTVDCTTVPALTSTSGTSLTEVTGYSVTVSGPTVYDAGSGAHVLLGGTGNLRCCTMKNVSTGDAGVRWMRCPSALDVAVSSTARDQTSGDFQALVGQGRLAYVPEWVSVTDGGGVDVTIHIRKKEQR